MISEINIGDYIVWSGWPKHMKPIKVVGFKDEQHLLITETTSGSTHLYLKDASLGQWLVTSKNLSLILPEELID